MIRTQAGTYEVMEDNRDGWNSEAFKERYSDILDKYDYIVGDWGYGQLRLRGFYESTNRKVPFEQRISALDEYLHEFCNFGCPYFVLRKVKSTPYNPDQPADDGDDLLVGGEKEMQPDEEIFVERKDRRRVHPRQNRHERNDRNQGAGERKERGDKPKIKSDRNGREGGKDRQKQNQMRPNRERDKVPTGQSQPKKE
ncbi:YutD family protein [Brevibacillus borstelensis]|uniref:YutD family protein n=1 Tax=Brevibacillus borstelensis TaxID=45462 RepID=UPI0030BCE1E6